MVLMDPTDPTWSLRVNPSHWEVGNPSFKGTELQDSCGHFFSHWHSCNTPSVPRLRVQRTGVAVPLIRRTLLHTWLERKGKLQKPGETRADTDWFLGTFTKWGESVSWSPRFPWNLTPEAGFQSTWLKWKLWRCPKSGKVWPFPVVQEFCRQRLLSMTLCSLSLVTPRPLDLTDPKLHHFSLLPTLLHVLQVRTLSLKVTKYMLQCHTRALQKESCSLGL
jgi:hypothetical protein